jgi:hypothetical protein
MRGEQALLQAINNRRQLRVDGRQRARNNLRLLLLLLLRWRSSWGCGRASHTDGGVWHTCSALQLLLLHLQLLL